MQKSSSNDSEHAWGHPDLPHKGWGLAKRECHLREEESLYPLSGYTLPRNKDIKEFYCGFYCIRKVSHNGNSLVPQSASVSVSAVTEE